MTEEPIMEPRAQANLRIESDGYFQGTTITDRDTGLRIRVVAVQIDMNARDQVKVWLQTSPWGSLFEVEGCHQVELFGERQPDVDHQPK